MSKDIQQAATPLLQDSGNAQIPQQLDVNDDAQNQDVHAINQQVQVQQNGLAGPGAHPPAAAVQLPRVSELDPASGNRIACPLDENDPGLSNEVRQIVARVRRNPSDSLKKYDVLDLLEYLHRLEGVQWPTQAANKPQAGQIYLFDKRICGTRFMEDRHHWLNGQKSSSSGNLKIGKQIAGQVRYAYNEELNRRSYLLLANKNTTLVHYFPRTEGNKKERAVYASTPGGGEETGDEEEQVNVEPDEAGADGMEPESDNHSDTDDKADHILDTKGLVAGSADDASLLNGQKNREVPLKQLARQAADKDLSDKLKKLDVAASEPSIYSPLVRSGYRDPGASGSGQQRHPRQNLEMPPPAAIPAAKARIGADNTNGEDPIIKSFLNLMAQAAEKEQQVRTLESQLEAAQNNAEDKIEAAVKAKEAENAQKLKEVSDKCEAVKRALQQQHHKQLETANAKTAAEQARADGFCRKVNELQKQIQEKDDQLSAQKTRCKKRTKDILAMGRNAKKARKYQEKLEQGVQELMACAEEEDSSCIEGPPVGNPDSDPDIESEEASSSGSKTP